jgi:hypothetical protein
MSYLDEGGRGGILSWIGSTDHKRIGVLYLASMLILFFVAVAIGVLMRIEQLVLEPPIFAPQTYNAFFTVHGVIMIFMFVLPGLPAVFGNFFLPIMIGARDVSFPRPEPAVVVFLPRRRADCDLLSLYGKWSTGYRMDVLCAFQPEEQHQRHIRGSGSVRTGLFFNPDRIEFHYDDSPAAGSWNDLAPHAPFRLVSLRDSLDSAAGNAHYRNYAASHHCGAPFRRWRV